MKIAVGGSFSASTARPARRTKATAALTDLNPPMTEQPVPQWWRNTYWGTHRNQIAEIDHLLDEIGWERVTVEVALQLLNAADPQALARAEGWLGT